MIERRIGVVRVQPPQEQRHRDRRRMRDHVDRRLPLLLDIQPASTSGARSRASGRSSAVYVRSMMAASGGSPASSSALRLVSGEAARKIARGVAQALRVQAADHRRLVADSRQRARLLLVGRRSAAGRCRWRTSRRCRGSRARAACRCRPAPRSLVSANLVLRCRGRMRRRVPEPAAHDAADPNHDAAADIRDGHRQEHRLRPVPHGVDQCAEHDDQQRAYAVCSGSGL